MSLEIAIIDLETTGFLPAGGLITEVGIVKLDLDSGNREIIYDQLVREDGFGDKHRNSWIFQNSDLKFDDVANAQPLDVSKIQEIFDTYAVTAYNKRFDLNYLADRGLTFNELDCPMRLMKPICKAINKKGHIKFPNVQESYDFLFPNNSYVETHRGADDAFHESQIVHELYKMNIFDPKKIF